MSGGEEFLGRIPFLFAEVIEAFGPIGSLEVLPGHFGFGLLLEQAGVEGLEPFAPAVLAGPIFDGGKTFPELVGGGLERTGMAELKEDPESVKGARGFAREPLEAGRDG